MLRCGGRVGRKIVPAIWQGRRNNATETTSSVNNVPESASTVIIGGGVIGCSVAYHLAKAGQKNVILLEKTELTAGSTWHAAGLTTYYHPGINVKKLHYYSMELYKTLEKETGQAVGLHTCGSLRLAASPERCDEFRYQMTRARWHPNPQWLLEPDEIKEIHPLLNMDSILLGLYNPADGHIDPYSVTHAMAAGARQYGAKLVQGVEVTGTQQRSDGGWTVDTNKGSITADRIVNAAGFWARQVAELSGVSLPVVPIEHTYLVSASIPEVQALKKEVPVIRDLEGSYYLRQERDGLLFGIYESPESMKVVEDWYSNGPPKGFGMELFESDLERLSPNISAALELVPCLQKAEIINSVCGPITYSPDVAGLLGPYQGLRNYWTAAGFGYGIIQGGGSGKYLADWILSGEPPYDLIELDANRFDFSDKHFLFAKARESYGMNTCMGWPKEERTAGRPTGRKSALYSLLKDEGGVMGFHSGWDTPNWFNVRDDPNPYQPSFRRTNWFEPVQRECELVLKKAGMIDLTPFGKIEIKGPDASAFVNYVYANKLPKQGRCVLSHLLSPAGRVYAEHTVTCFSPEHFLAITGAASEIHDLRWLEQQASGYNVTLSNVTDSMDCLGLAGPLSRDILSSLTSDDLSPKAFPFLAVKEIEIAGVKVTATRISYTGELGWEFLAPPANIQAVYIAIEETGKCGHFGAYAMNSLRLEKGFRGWGAEMNMDKNPVDAGLMSFVDMTKGDFIGQKGLQKVLDSGEPKSVLKLLALDPQATLDPEGNETVWIGDKVVGNTTSGAYSVTLQRPLCFAYVPASALDQEMEVELLGERIKATVLQEPPLQIQARRRPASNKS